MDAKSVGDRLHSLPFGPDGVKNFLSLFLAKQVWATNFLAMHAGGKVSDASSFTEKIMVDTGKLAEDLDGGSPFRRGRIQALVERAQDGTGAIDPLDAFEYVPERCSKLVEPRDDKSVGWRKSLDQGGQLRKLSVPGRNLLKDLRAASLVQRGNSRLDVLVPLALTNISDFSDHFVPTATVTRRTGQHPHRHTSSDG